MNISIRSLSAARRHSAAFHRESCVNIEKRNKKEMHFIPVASFNAFIAIAVTLFPFLHNGPFIFLTRTSFQEYRFFLAISNQRFVACFACRSFTVSWWHVYTSVIFFYYTLGRLRFSPVPCFRVMARRFA